MGTITGLGYWTGLLDSPKLQNKTRSEGGTITGLEVLLCDLPKEFVLLDVSLENFMHTHTG